MTFDRARVLSALRENRGHQFAVIDNGDAVTKAVSFVHVVRRDQNCELRLLLILVSISQTATRETGSSPVVGSSKRKCADVHQPARNL